jgi:N-carbamoyl-L-amino-acid hydrolase
MTSSARNAARSLRVNGERLWARHMEMARIGAIGGSGSCRLAMTAEDAEARALLDSWCREAGLKVTVDRAGNMYAVREGSAPDRPLVAAGSHLDTQPHGGRFDGVSGVLAALEALETIDEAGIRTLSPMAVINWTNEEGVRFAPGLLGSSWYAGLLDDAALAGLQAADGTFFDDEARLRGWLGESSAKPAIGAFFELHIEQGPILEREGLPIGIVTSVQGLTWLDVTVTGMDGHAGTTPLDHRQDALLAAARMLVALNDAGRASGPDARVSVGRITTATDGPSTIVGHASFVIDIRHPNAATLAALAAECEAICRSLGSSSGCAVEVSRRISIPPTQFDLHCVEALEVGAERLGYSHMRLASGALHDASNVAGVAPTAMIFVRCRDGISHNVNEYASPEDLAAGASVLTQALVTTAGIG